MQARVAAGPLLRRRGSLRSALALVCVLLACQSAPVESAAAVQLGAAFTLRVGQEALVEGTGLRLRFTGVESDSRCPSDVTCIWEGDAEIRLLLTPAGGAPINLALHTSLDPRSVVTAGYRVALERLDPAPRSDRSVAPDQYVVALQVTREP